MPTFDSTQRGYHNMWKQASLRQTDLKSIEVAAKKLAANKTIYLGIEKATGVPWYMIGAIHYREASYNFKAHLHCGDPLTARTYHVPKGRPAKGQPPFTWAESAIDAMTMAPHSLNKIKNWTIERILYECERYNGWGYMGRVNSPYVWSGTNLYSGGKYVADGVYDPNHWDKQLGVAALIKQVAKIDDTITLKSSPSVPNDLIAEDKTQHAQDKKRRIIRDGAAGTAVAGGGTGASKGLTDSKVVNNGLMGVGVLLGLLCVGTVIYMGIKRRKIKDAAKLQWVSGGIDAPKT